MSWCEIWICIICIVILVKILRDNYIEKFGGKK